VVFPVGIGLRDPRSQKRDLGHPSISPFSFLSRLASASVTLESVHPLAVVGIALFVGVDVAALVVEADIAVLLAHVDLELAGGPPALPAVVVVTETEEALAKGRAHTPPRCTASKEEAQQRTAQDNKAG
jgi:hypothetical protein